MKYMSLVGFWVVLVLAFSNSGTSNVFDGFLLAGCFWFCLFFAGLFFQNGVPGVRFNLSLVLVALFHLVTG